MLAVVLALLCADLLLEAFGIPGTLRNGICSIASHHGAELHVGQLCIGVFRGLVLRGVSMNLQTPGGILFLAADDIVADFSPIGLLSSDTPLEKIIAKNLTVELLSHEENSLFYLQTDEFSFLTPEDAKGHLDFSSTLNGIRFNCSADIVNLNQFIPMLQSFASTPTVETTGRNPALCKTLESISTSMEKMDFIREDTSITLELALDCNSPNSYQLEGGFSLSDAILNDVVISRLRGKLACHDGMLRLDDLMLLLSTGDILRANADFNASLHKVNCELDGTLAPTTIAKLLGKKLDTNGQLEWLDKPFHWHGTLKECSLDASHTENNMSWKISKLALGNVPIDNITFDLSYSEETVVIRNIEIVSEKSLSIKGGAEFDVKENALSADFQGDIHIASLLREARLAPPEQFRPGRDSTLTFNLSLPKSPLSPAEWNLTSTFSLPRQRLAYWDMHNLHGTMDLKQGVLNLHDLRCELDYHKEWASILHRSAAPILPRLSDYIQLDASGDMLSPHQEETSPNLPLASFSLEIDLNNLLKSDKSQEENKTLVVKNSLSLSISQDNSLQELLSWSGKVNYSITRNTLEVNGEGTTFADAVYNTFLKESKISGVEYFAPFVSEKTPQTFSLQIPRFHLNSPQKMRLEMDIDGTDCGFGTFHARKATTHLSIDAERLRFKDIKGVTSEGYETDLQIEVQFQPFFLKITDLHLKGDPMVAQDFVMSSEAKTIYQEIWRDFKWSPNALPFIHIPLIYYTSNDLGSDWDFRLDGNIKADTASYREQPLNDLSCNIALTLPGDLVLKPIHVTVDNAKLEGECTFHFVGSFPCFFKITSSNAYIEDASASKKDDSSTHMETSTAVARPENAKPSHQDPENANAMDDEMKTAIRPAQILSLLNPDLKKSLETLSFQKDTMFSCTGSFFLIGAPSLEIKGNIESPQCSFRDWTFKNLKGNWIYENNQAFWSTEKATFMGGDFKTTGVHNIVTRTTDLVCVGKDMSWEDVMKGVFKDKKEEYNNVPGKFNITCNLQVKQDWAGNPLQLGGDGHFSLREADLWQMPLMKQLSYLVEVTTFKIFSSNKNKNSSTFGSISAVKGNVEFHGPRVVVTDFNTNGTIIALSGAGEYNIFNENVHFEVNGSPLKEVTILSTLLKPLSWCFNAELQGKRSEAKWKMKTALSKIFSTDD